MINKNSGKTLVFDGKNFVIEDRKGNSSKETTNETLYKDESYEEELEEEELDIMGQKAKEYLDNTTPGEIKDKIENRMEETLDLAKTYEELKKYYISMQDEADKKDGGKDKTNPDYYKTRDMESIEIMELKHGTKATMAFCILTSERYEYRVGNKRIQKGNTELDLKKADWYLNKYKELSDKIGTREEILGLSTMLT